MRTQEIWLVFHADGGGIDRMTKRQPETQRHEIAVKVIAEWDPAALRPPTLVRSIKIEDWREGLDVSGDLKLKQATITEAEAQMIMARRRAEMVENLRQMGYRIDEPEPAEDEPGNSELRLLQS
jgi:hypothetical protein